MYQGGHRASSRDGGSYRDPDRDRRSRSPHARRADDRDGDYRRPRKGTIAYTIHTGDGIV